MVLGKLGLIDNMACFQRLILLLQRLQLAISCLQLIGQYLLLSFRLGISNYNTFRCPLSRFELIFTTAQTRSCYIKLCYQRSNTGIGCIQFLGQRLLVHESPGALR